MLRTNGLLISGRLFSALRTRDGRKISCRDHESLVGQSLVMEESSGLEQPALMPRGLGWAKEHEMFGEPTQCLLKKYDKGVVVSCSSKEAK